MSADFRKTFDRIPEAFDRYRPRYCDALFSALIDACGLGPGKRALEIGPGTGQATEPILETGCDYTGVELGENFSRLLREKYGQYSNFTLLNADFETCPLEKGDYDLVYSAATIQWIPEALAYTRAFELLKPGGCLAMFMTRSDERTANPALREAIDRVYDAHFHVKEHYSQRFDYEAAPRYGFGPVQYREWTRLRTLTAEEYIAYIGTHCEHITLEEPYRTRFFDGVREAIRDAGGSITILDTIPLYLARKPE